MNGPTTPRTRRSVLAGTLGIVALAGCADSEPDETTLQTPTHRSPTGSTRTEGIPPSATGTTGEGIEAVTIHSGDGGCGDEPSATFAETEDGVGVSGHVVTPTPCHVATLESREFADGTATFEIGFEDDTAAEACVECVGRVPFEVQASLDPAVDRVVVEVGGLEPERFEWVR